MLGRVPRQALLLTGGGGGGGPPPPSPQEGTHHNWLCRARETALVLPPHLTSQLWVAEVGTQGHWCGHIYHIDGWPVAGGG